MIALLGGLSGVGAAVAQLPALAHVAEHQRLVDARRAALPKNLDAAVEAATSERSALLARTAQLEAALAEPEATPERSFIVVSIGDRALTLWEKGKPSFRARAGVGMGRAVLDGDVYSFDTPRGRYSVTATEEAPIWNAPDWHYLELAKKLRADTVILKRSQATPLKDGSELRVIGNAVNRCTGDACVPFPMGQELVIDNKVFVPPGGTLSRQYPEILGTHRLKMGDSYAIHGTNKPGSVGRASSHGCIRLRNEDIDVLYERVKVGTPVLVY